MSNFRFIILSIALVISNDSFAQTDSSTVVNAPWHSQKIAKGITLKQYQFEQTLFGSNQSVSILEFRIRRRYIVGVKADSQQLKITSAFGAESNALAALNGTFFDIKNGGSVDYIRVQGKVVNKTRLNNNGRRAVHQKAAIVINKGRPAIKEWDSTANWEDQLRGDDVMLTGPLLIYHQRPLPLDTAAFFVLRHPRSAVAIRGNRVLLITIDGRNEHAAGMSLPELANFLRWMKVDDGINLDGGGSTTLWIKDQGVVNYPSDNKKWDHDGERPVANVIIIKKRK